MDKESWAEAVRVWSCARDVFKKYTAREPISSNIESRFRNEVLRPVWREFKDRKLTLEDLQTRLSKALKSNLSTVRNFNFSTEFQQWSEYQKKKKKSLIQRHWDVACMLLQKHFPDEPEAREQQVSLKSNLLPLFTAYYSGKLSERDFHSQVSSAVSRAHPQLENVDFGLEYSCFDSSKAPACISQSSQKPSSAERHPIDVEGALKARSEQMPHQRRSDPSTEEKDPCEDLELPVRHLFQDASDSESRKLGDEGRNLQAEEGIDAAEKQGRRDSNSSDKAEINEELSDIWHCGKHLFKKYCEDGKENLDTVNDFGKRFLGHVWKFFHENKLDSAEAAKHMYKELRSADEKLRDVDFHAEFRTYKAKRTNRAIYANGLCYVALELGKKYLQSNGKQAFKRKMNPVRKAFIAGSIDKARFSSIVDLIFMNLHPSLAGTSLQHEHGLWMRSKLKFSMTPVQLALHTRRDVLKILSPSKSDSSSGTAGSSKEGDSPVSKGASADGGGQRHVETRFFTPAYIQMGAWKKMDEKRCSPRKKKEQQEDETTSIEENVEIETEDAEIETVGTFLNDSRLVAIINRVLSENKMSLEISHELIHVINSCARERAKEVLQGGIENEMIRNEAEKQNWSTQNVGRNMQMAMIAMAQVEEEARRCRVLNSINSAERKPAERREEQEPAEVPDKVCKEVKDKGMAARRRERRKRIIDAEIASVIKRNKKRKSKVSVSLGAQTTPLSQSNTVPYSNVGIVETNTMRGSSKLTLQDMIMLFSEDPRTRHAPLTYIWMSRVNAPLLFRQTRQRRVRKRY